MTDQDALKAFRRKTGYSSKFAARRGTGKAESSQSKTVRIGRIEVLNPNYKGK